jgi:hypothetical protein
MGAYYSGGDANSDSYFLMAVWKPPHPGKLLIPESQHTTGLLQLS